jgi:hypothetical protein
MVYHVRQLNIDDIGTLDLSDIYQYLSAPDSSAPDSSAPDSSAPDSSAPDSSAPDSSTVVSDKSNQYKSNQYKSNQYFRDKLDNPDYHIYIVLCKPSLTHSVILVGIGTLFIEQKLIHDFKNCGHIEDVVIHPDHRHKKLCKSVILDMIYTCKRENCYKIVLNCAPNLVKMYTHILSNGMKKICVENSISAYFN